MMPPVGKSGAGTKSISSSLDRSGFSISAWQRLRSAPDPGEPLSRSKCGALGSLGSVRGLTQHLIFEAGSDHGERFADRYDTMAAE